MLSNTYVEPNINEYDRLCERPVQSYETLSKITKTIFSKVEKEGDEALRFYTEKYDNVSLENLLVSDQEYLNSKASIDDELKKSIKIAYENIYQFHKAQMQPDIKIEICHGVVCEQKAIPIERVGLYIPGGSAPLFSTVLMLAIPALLAGCNEVILCTPPMEDGSIHPAILYTAKLCGVNYIYKVGGAQAIAAMSIGTKTINKVSKIFGPGNQYVAAAKTYASNYGVAMDLPAGPSELLIYADQEAIPKFVAADLLSQAEHGSDSQVVLVTNESNLVSKVNEELKDQVERLPRRDVVKEALKSSLAIVMNDVADAWQFINQYAPEHLIVASNKPEDYISYVKNAGSVFLGNYSPESAGDYASGTNHTLPTSGWAKSYNGVNIDSFLRKVTFQSISKFGIQKLGQTIVKMAEAEGLQAHANAVKIRLKTK